MKNLRGIEKMTQLKDKSFIQLPAKDRRSVTLEVNTAGPTMFILELSKNKFQFLANVDGYETLVFVADGAAKIHADADGAEVWYYTQEQEVYSTEVEDPVAFTKMWTRRPRNQALELMTHMANMNAEARLQQILAGYDLKPKAVDPEKPDPVKVKEPEPPQDLGEKEKKEPVKEPEAK